MQKILIPNEDVELEAEFYQSNSMKEKIFLLCNPDPRMGGNFHNNVISRIFEALVQHDISSLRFNFRGVGRSTGSFSNGDGELSDVKACVDFLINNIGANKIFICGYSFGAVIGCSAINYSDKIIGFAAISLPFDRYAEKFEQMSQTRKSKLFIQGDSDNFVPISNFEKHYASYQDPKAFKILRGANHFYWGFEERIAREILDFYKSLK